MLLEGLYKVGCVDKLYVIAFSLGREEGQLPGAHDYFAGGGVNKL